MMNNDKAGPGELFQSDQAFPLDELFHKYREACPEVEVGPLFMPTLWQKIEARSSFWSVFQGFARAAMAGCAALALLLLALNLTAEKSSLLPSYPDALVADHSAEKTYYAESVRRRLIEPIQYDSQSPDQ